jgi:hypothetical protein
MIIIPESKIQQQAFVWFNNAYCTTKQSPRLIIHSVPNGIPIPIPAQERARALDLLHKTGMVNGVSDLMIHGILGRCIWAECKTETGVQSEDQIKLEKRVNDLGGIYILFRSLAEFQKKISIHIQWLTEK